MLNGYSRNNSNSVYDVSCPLCGAFEKELCQTASGKDLSLGNVHLARRYAFIKEFISSEMQESARLVVDSGFATTQKKRDIAFNKLLERTQSRSHET